MGVRHGLPRGRPIVKAEVESVWLELLGQGALDPTYHGPHLSLLAGRKLKEAGNVASGNDERMALGDWEPVSNGDGDSAPGQDTLRSDIAEGAGIRHAVSLSGNLRK